MLRVGARAESAPKISPEFFLSPVTVKEKKKFKGRKVTRLLVLFSFLLATLGGLFISGGVSPTTAPKANAFINFCLGLNAYKGISLGEWPGLNLGTPGVATGAAISAVLDPYGDSINKPYAGMNPPRAITAYEWWGTAGQFWMINNLEELKPAADCGVGAITWFGVSSVANVIWQIVLLVGGLAIMIYTIATSANILGIFLDPLGTILTSSLNSLYLPFLIPMIMLAALWVAWVGLVKQRSSESIQGIAWVIGAAVFSIVFLSNPTFFAKNLNGFIGQLQVVIISTINYPTASIGTDPTQALCYAGEPSAPGYDVTRPTYKNDEGKDVEIPGFDQASANSQSVISRQFQCLMWETFIFTPWIGGTFGDLATAVPQNTGAPPVTIAGRPIDPLWANSFALQYLEARTENHDEVVDNRNNLGFTGIDPDILEKQIDWLQRCYAQPLQDDRKPPPPDCNGSVSQQADLSRFVGNPNGGGSQISISLLALIAIIFGGIPIIILSLKLLFYQLMTVVMLLLAPLYLIVGIHPGFGRRVALGWLEYIVNVSIKRIALTFMIAILMVVIQVIINA